MLVEQRSISLQSRPMLRPWAAQGIAGESGGSVAMDAGHGDAPGIRLL
jgi:hypothetical protein